MGGPAEVAAEAKQVESELVNLGSAVEQHDSLLGQLEQRLSDVLMGETEAKEVAAPAPEEQLCALANRIRSIRRGVHNQSDQLRSIMRRLEL